MGKRTRSAAAAEAGSLEEPAEGKIHLRFDDADGGDDAEELDGLSSDEVTEDDHVEGSSSGSGEQDEEPEAVSTVTGRRRAKEQEQAMREFELAALQARRRANQSKDAKRKAAKPTAPLPPAADDDLPTSEDEEADEPAPAPPSGRKRYLDPSIFASASDQLERAKEEAKALEAERTLLRRKDGKKRKRKRAQADATGQEVDGVVYRHLGEATTRTAQPRHVQADKFVRSRLYNPSAYRKSLPKTTALSKAAMGKRLPSAGLSNLARRRGKPASTFVRAT